MEHRRAWIPMSDGTRLAARLWLPDALPAWLYVSATGVVVYWMLYRL